MATIQTLFPIRPMPKRGKIEADGFYQMDDATYFADPVKGGSINCSSVKDFLKGSPASFRFFQQNPPPPNPGMSLGTVVHAKAMNQPVEVEVYDGKEVSWYAAATKAFRTKVLKAGRVPLLPSEAQNADAMVQALLNHPLANTLIRGRENEVVAYELVGIATEVETGLKLRGKFDILGQTESLIPRIADIKITSSIITPKELAKTIATYNYHIQSAYYTEIAGILTGTDPDQIPFDFIFVSSKAPFEVAVVRLPERALRLGDAQAHAALRGIKERSTTAIWEGWPERLHLDLPVYVYGGVEFDTADEENLGFAHI